MAKKKNSLLWKIEKPGTPSSYLFGTMHITDQKAYVLQDLVEQKIMECSVFAAEMNLDEVNHSAMAETMDLEGDLRLSVLLKPKIYQRLQKIFEKQIGIPLIHFDRSQPIMISNLLTESLLSRADSISLDANLWAFAKQADKITLGIESFEEQLSVLGKIPLKYQLKGLSEMAQHLKKAKKQLQKLTELYAKGDIQQLYKTSKKQAGKLRKTMIYDRNYIMANRIAKLANEQAVFVAIGAGHLSGAKGVIRLLKQEGFKLKPLFPSKEVKV